MAMRSRNKVSVAFSMASMTDIVFLLLIFFIIISTMVSPYGLNVTLPTSSAKSTEKAKVTISIESDLTHSLNGQVISPDAIEPALLEMLQGVEKPFITLRVDQSVPTGESVRILDIANRNKYGIVLATQPAK